LSKSEKYLEEATKMEARARESGEDTSAFLVKLATASLKHRQVIEGSILPMAPEDGRPEVIKAGDYAKNAYNFCRDALNSKGIATPKNPFDGQ
jgi:hypothetical protein